MVAAPGLDAPARLRRRLSDLYAAYDEVLDEGEFERWPEFFTKTCVYKITARENYAAGLPIAMVYCESRAMLADRVVALRDTTLYAPRTMRRVMGAPVLTAIDPGEMRLRQSFAVFETLLNEPSRVFLCGRCYDRVVDEGGVLRFVERVCVADATLVPVSLVFPI